MFTQPEVPSVDVDEAVDKIDGGALLIDVREQAEWDEARVPGAVHRPLGEINDWWQDLPRDREIVVMCRTGNRSAQVVHALATQGEMDNLWNLTGGIVAWADSGGEIVDG